jgi:hypothetical protein
LVLLALSFSYCSLFHLLLFTLLMSYSLTKD